MKLKILKTILNEEIVELEENLNDVLIRLYNQQGNCTEHDSNGKPLEFVSSNDGKFKITNFYGPSVPSFRLYSVCGQVFNDGKTKVSIYTVLDRTAYISIACATFIPLVLLLIYICFQPILNPPTIDNFFFAVVLITIYTIATFVLSLLEIKAQHKRMPADIKIMKNIVKNKLKKWLTNWSIIFY